MQSLESELSLLEEEMEAELRVFRTNCGKHVEITLCAEISRAVIL